MKTMKFTYNPLKTCKFRIHGLASIKGAKFGMTRKHANGNPRPHQGIDLATPEGYRVYAVENGEIVSTSKGLDGYGFTVTLKLDCKHKPELHIKFAFYAHLDRVDVRVGQDVKAGEQLGLSGDTGNAKGMSTEVKGGHLHFELRTIQKPGLGLMGRFDPEPFVNFTQTLKV